MIILLLTFGVQSQNIIDTSIIKSRVIEWSNAHNNRDLTVFKKLYATSLIYYGEDLASEKVLKSKNKAFKKTKFKSQSITSGITLKIYDSGYIECSFTKKVFYEDETKEYPAYLLFKNYNGEYLICGESDKITDNFINYKLDIGKPISLKTSLTEEKEGNIGSVLLLIVSIIVIILFVRYFKKRQRLKLTVHDTSNNLTEEAKKGNRPETIGLTQKDIVALKGIVNKTKGDLFENFICQNFDQKYFKLMVMRSDKGVNGVYPEDNKNPDLEINFEHNGYKVTFAVECKWRQSLSSTGYSVQVARKDQLDNYRKFQKERNIDVYVALGLGGSPDIPDELFLIPLSKVSWVMSYNKLKIYQRNKNSRFFLDMHTNVLS